MLSLAIAICFVVAIVSYLIDRLILSDMAETVGSLALCLLIVLVLVFLAKLIIGDMTDTEWLVISFIHPTKELVWRL